MANEWSGIGCKCGVRRTNIAGIWVAFFSRCQQQSCGQGRPPAATPDTPPQIGDAANYRQPFDARAEGHGECQQGYWDELFQTLAAADPHHRELSIHNGAPESPGIMTSKCRCRLFDTRTMAG